MKKIKTKSAVRVLLDRCESEKGILCPTCGKVAVYFCECPGTKSIAVYLREHPVPPPTEDIYAWKRKKAVHQQEV
jgi:hypothetical protein